MSKTTFLRDPMKSSAYPHKRQIEEEITNPQETFIVVSKMGNLGPVPVISTNLFIDSDNERFLNRLAVYTITALGQGSFLHEGLYGPLPVPSDELSYLSLNYAIKINDKYNTDPRNKGQSYCVLSLLFPRNHRLQKRSNLLEQIIKKQLHNVNDIEQINKNFLIDLHTKVIAIFE